MRVFASELRWGKNAKKLAVNFFLEIEIQFCPKVPALSQLSMPQHQYFL